MISGRNKFNKIKKIIYIFVKVVNILPIELKIGLFNHFRTTKGNKGILIRYILLKTIIKKCGDNVVIYPDVYIFNPCNLEIGDNVSIHPNCYIEAYGSIIIGNNVSIAHNTSILSVNHTWDDKSIPIKYNPISSKRVNIENDVWIGCGVRILAGVTINTRSIVAAGAVVTKSVLSNAIYGGIPAKKLKDI